MTTNMHNRGFTMLIAVITGTILLLIAFGMASIALKQQVLNTTARESAIAFYAADAALDCALYLDAHRVFANTLSTETIVNSSLKCGNRDDLVPQNSNSIFSQRLDGGWTWDIDVTHESDEIQWGAEENTFCGQFEIAKTKENNVTLKTVIRARGYNTCDQNSTRRLERGVEAEYYETIQVPVASQPEGEPETP